MTRARFEQLVAEAVARLPREFREAMENIAVVVDDEPSAALLDEMAIEPPDSLCGLYEGTPLTERHWDDGNRLPDRITLFQRVMEEDAEDDDEMRVMVEETLIHEVGHYFGLSEEAIEAIEEEYWHGGASSDADES